MSSRSDHSLAISHHDKENPSARKSYPKALSYSAMAQACQPIGLDDNAADLDPIDFMQIYQAQTQNEICSVLKPYEEFPAFNPGGTTAPSRRLDHRTSDIHTVDDPWDHYEQLSMSSPEMMSSVTSQVLMPNTEINSKSMDMSHPSVRECQVQRRREQNCAAQRACRARKERYTRDLKKDYSELVCRYNELVQVLRDLNVDHPGMAMQHKIRLGEQQNEVEDGFASTHQCQKV